MKTEVLSSLFAKLAIGVATATTIAGGTAVIASASTNAVQDQRLNQHDEALKKIETLSDKLEETNRNVVILNERMERGAYVPRQ